MSLSTDAEINPGNLVGVGGGGGWGGAGRKARDQFRAGSLF